METVARSYLMAGVALVGAGAIAVGPIQPLPPDVQVPATVSATSPVELSALVNPITLWANVLSASVTNAGGIAETVLANPAPILGNIVGNQLITADVLTSFMTTFASGFINGVGNMPASVRAAVEEILAGQIYDGVGNLALALINPVVAGAFGALGQLPDVLAVLKNPFLNAASVVETAVTQGIVGIGLPLLISALSPVLQIGLTGQAIYDGVKAGDFEAVVNALISFPSDMANTILNGNPVIGGGGLLGPNGGLVPGLLGFRQAIADAIKPPELLPSVAVNRAPESGMQTFTLNTGELQPAAIPNELKATEPESVTGVGTDIDADPTLQPADETAAAPHEALGEIETESPAEETDAVVVEDTIVVKDTTQKKPRFTLGKFAPTTRAGDKATKPGQRAAAALKSLGDDVGKAAKKFGDDVKKALGGKKKERKASSDAGE